MHCNGEDVTIVETTRCVVPLSVLQSAPYNLGYGDSLVFTVNCFNQYGWSMVSRSNSTMITSMVKILSVDNAAFPDSMNANFDCSEAERFLGQPLENSFAYTVR